MSKQPRLAVPGGPSFNLDDPKAGVILTFVVGLLQVAAALLQASGEFKTFLFFLSLVLGGGVAAWAAYRWPQSKAPISVYVAGLLAAITAFVLMSGRTIGGTDASTPTTYHILLKAFAYDPQDGTLDHDRPVAEIPIIIHDQFNDTKRHKTRSQGVVAKLPAPGPVLIGFCGIFQMHAVEEKHATRASALLIEIGIDPARLEACRG